MSLSKINRRKLIVNLENRSWSQVYRWYGAKGTIPARRARIYLLLGIIFSAVTYQIYSCYIVSSVGNQSLSKQYSSLFFQTKESFTLKIGNSEAFGGPQELRTTTTKERPVNMSEEAGENYELPKNVSDVDSHVTKNGLEFTKIISDVNAGNQDVKKSYEFTDNVRDVDVFNDVTEKAYESMTNASKVVTTRDISKDKEMTKNYSLVVMKSEATESYNSTRNDHQLCHLPPDLGPISVDPWNISMDEIEKKNPKVKFGGRYSPLDCLARQSVAIIVSFRDRMANLARFLNHMHPFLIKQKVEYGIFIVEQTGTQEFNRGKLMNVGFIETGSWQCYIFHDIDLLPLDQRNVYSCDPRHPRLYDAVAMLDGYEHRGIPLQGDYGGVSAVTEEQFSKANGYSNGYWGWGGEDNDLYYRLTSCGYAVTQYNSSIARYKPLKHEQKSANPKRHRLLLQTMRSYQMDGLSTLKYKVVSTSYLPLYTHIVVNVDQTYHELRDLYQESRNFKQLHERYIQPVLGRNKYILPNGR